MEELDWDSLSKTEAFAIGDIAQGLLFRLPRFHSVSIAIAHIAGLDEQDLPTGGDEIMDANMVQIWRLAQEMKDRMAAMAASGRSGPGRASPN